MSFDPLVPAHPPTRTICRRRNCLETERSSSRYRVRNPAAKSPSADYSEAASQRKFEQAHPTRPIDCLPRGMSTERRTG